MMLPFLLLAAAAPAEAAPAEAAPPEAAPPEREADEIVVTAVRDRCEVRIADRVIADREFRARAREWAAGRPVRVVVPSGSSYGCMARIAFRLQRYGVRFIHFARPGEADGQTTP